MVRSVSQLRPCGCDGSYSCPEEQRLHAATRNAWRQTDAIGIWYATVEYNTLHGAEERCTAAYFAHLPASVLRVPQAAC
jgi:hypothetical protein